MIVSWTHRGVHSYMYLRSGIARNLARTVQIYDLTLLGLDQLILAVKQLKKNYVHHLDAADYPLWLRND